MPILGEVYLFISPLNHNMGLPTEILRFFSTKNIMLTEFLDKPISAYDAVSYIKNEAKLIAEHSHRAINPEDEIDQQKSNLSEKAKKLQIQPYSIKDFLKDKPDLNSMTVLQICRKFAREGYLTALPPTNKLNVLGEVYFTHEIDEELAAYGVYDFFIDGFIAIRERFTDVVRPIGVKKGDEPSIGTCFNIGNGFIVTARHCVENMDRVSIADKFGGFEKAKNIYVDIDRNFDLAVIELETKDVESPYFRFKQETILEEVLTMGYPPIPGFLDIQLAEVTRINSYVKSSLGNIIGAGRSYTEKQNFILINAKVKGGNSGGPVINNRGEVVGVLVSISGDSENYKAFDSLGYGLAIPTSEILRFINNINEKADNVTKINFVNYSNGFMTSKH